MASAPHCDDFILLSAKVSLRCLCTVTLLSEWSPVYYCYPVRCWKSASEALAFPVSFISNIQLQICCNLYNLFVCLSVFSFVCFAYIFIPSDQLAISCSEIFLQDKALLCHDAASSSVSFHSSECALLLKELWSIDSPSHHFMHQPGNSLESHQQTIRFITCWRKQQQLFFLLDGEMKTKIWDVFAAKVGYRKTNKCVPT